MNQARNNKWTASMPATVRVKSAMAKITRRKESDFSTIEKHLRMMITAKMSATNQHY